jgi:hypothetical protein
MGRRWPLPGPAHTHVLIDPAGVDPNGPFQQVAQDQPERGGATRKPEDSLPPAIQPERKAVDVPRRARPPFHASLAPAYHSLGWNVESEFSHGQQPAPLIGQTGVPAGLSSTPFLPRPAPGGFDLPGSVRGHRG